MKKMSVASYMYLAIHTPPPLLLTPPPFSPQWIAGQDGSNLILNSVFQMRATGGTITLMRMGVGEKVNPAALTRKRSWAMPMQRTDTEKHMMVSWEKVSRCLCSQAPYLAFCSFQSGPFFHCVIFTHPQMSICLRMCHTMKRATGKFF